MSVRLILLLAIEGSIRTDATPAPAAGTYPREIIAAADRLRDGDLIFRRGRGAAALSVLALEGNGWLSHVGIVTHRAGHVWIVHAVPAEAAGEADATKAEPLETYLSSNRATLAAVYRLKPISDGSPAAIARRAARIAEGYAQAKVPFNARFDSADPGTLYCTELVQRAYQTAGVDLEVHFTEFAVLGHRFRVVTPRDVIDSTRLSRAI